VRPRKIIIYVNSNESELSVVKYMLDIKGYKPLAASSTQECMNIVRTERVIDLVVIVDESPYLEGQVTSQQLVVKIKRITPYVPIMVLVNRAEACEPVRTSDALLVWKRCATAQLMEHIRIMSARKRGPRKGSKHQVNQLVTA
jgi:DNA-binding response OmpR family regulator